MLGLVVSGSCFSHFHNQPIGALQLPANTEAYDNVLQYVMVNQGTIWQLFKKVPFNHYLSCSCSISRGWMVKEPEN